MTRIALGLGYTGSQFHGWQFQKDSLPTVQQAFENALSRVADQPVRVTCAGRTDSGVHATQQVVHFDTTAVRADKAWVLGVNAHLPDSVAVSWSRQVPDEFDARFSATARHYLYCIYNHPVRPGVGPGLFTREHRPLAADAMHAAAQALCGENDFTSYRAAKCQSNTPMRNVHAVSVHRAGDLVLISITANAFLHHMVRNIAGVLLDIGAGEKAIDWAGELLAARDRNLGSVTAAPDGLYLVDVHYPKQFGIPAGPCLPHFFAHLQVP